ncbi:hypothetical protein [Schaalia sp. ZJ1691]|uniref:hypothetical protein n=1 Tax=Schaalia sp. ZJ1691 TaxID=2709404 RepID=UPI001F152768|nr:hypothetical protein [Schaalia sp. ZJ1691]
MADEFQDRSSKSEWVYQDISTGDVVPVKYLTQDTLYLFSTNDAIRKSYNFEKCQLGSIMLNQVDTRFNLPSKDGRAVFLVGKFEGLLSGEKNKELSVNCEDLPDKSQLALGYKEFPSHGRADSRLSRSLYTPGWNSKANPSVKV